MLTNAVILIALGLHPVDGKPVAHAGGSFTTVEACKAAAESFLAEAAKAGIPVGSVIPICVETNFKIKAAVAL